MSMCGFSIVSKKWEGNVGQMRGGRGALAWGQQFILRCVCVGDCVYKYDVVSLHGGQPDKDIPECVDVSAPDH